MSPYLFTDFDEYAHAIRDIDLNVHLIHPRAGLHIWSVQELTLESLRLQFVEEGSGILAQGNMHRDGWGFYVQLSGTPVSINGERLGPGRLIVLPPGAEFCISGCGAVNWFSVFVPSCLLSDDAEPFSRRSSIYTTRCSNPLFQRLQSQVSSGRECAKKLGLSRLRSPDFALLQDDLLSSVRAVLSNGVTNPPKCPTQNALRLVGRAVELIRDHRDLRLSVRHLAATLDVSERTLLYAFRSQLDVNPQEFLIEYRVQQARRDLQGSELEQVTVGAVAAKHGFFDFGRFAAYYRKLYGELPSVTLRRRK